MLLFIRSTQNGKFGRCQCRDTMNICFHLIFLRTSGSFEICNHYQCFWLCVNEIGLIKFIYLFWYYKAKAIMLKLETRLTVMLTEVIISPVSSNHIDKSTSCHKACFGNRIHGSTYVVCPSWQRTSLRSCWVSMRQSWRTWRSTTRTTRSSSLESTSGNRTGLCTKSWRWAPTTCSVRLLYRKALLTSWCLCLVLYNEFCSKI